MSSLAALYRLRPAASWLSAVLVSAVLCAVVWLLPDPTPSAHAERVMWCASLILPFVLGRAAYLATLPVMAGSLMWTVPRFHTMLRRGSVTLGVLISLPFGVAQWNVAGLASGAFALALALIAYNSSTFSALMAERWPRAGAELFAWLPTIVLIAIMTVVVAPPGAVTSLSHAGSAPAIVAALAAVAVAARPASTISAMLDAQRGARAIVAAAVPSAASLAPDDSSASRMLGASAVGWAKAWLYETMGDRRGRRIAAWLVETVVIAYVIEAMLSIAPVLGIALASMYVWRALRVRALPLSDGIFYPASRLTRATVAFWSRVAATTARVVVLFAFIAAFEVVRNRWIPRATHVSGLPLGGGLVPAANGTPALLAVTLGVFVVIGLVAQTGRATMALALGGTWRRRTGRPYASYLMRLLVPMAGAIAFAHWARADYVAREGAEVFVLLLGSLMFYWLALRRSSLTMDLA